MEQLALPNGRSTLGLEDAFASAMLTMVWWPPELPDISLQKSRHDESKRFRADRKTKTNEVVYWQSLGLLGMSFLWSFIHHFKIQLGLTSVSGYTFSIFHLKLKGYFCKSSFWHVNKIRIDMTLGIHRRSRLRFDAGFDFRMFWLFWFSFFREKLQKVKKSKNQKKNIKKQKFSFKEW